MDGNRPGSDTTSEGIAHHDDHGKNTVLLRYGIFGYAIISQLFITLAVTALAFVTKENKTAFFALILGVFIINFVYELCVDAVSALDGTWFWTWSVISILLITGVLLVTAKGYTDAGKEAKILETGSSQMVTDNQDTPASMEVSEDDKRMADNINYRRKVGLGLGISSVVFGVITLVYHYDFSTVIAAENDRAA